MLNGWNRKVRITSAMMQGVKDHAAGLGDAAFFPLCSGSSRSSASRPLGLRAPRRSSRWGVRAQSKAREFRRRRLIGTSGCRLPSVSCRRLASSKASQRLAKCQHPRAADVRATVQSMADRAGVSSRRRSPGPREMTTKAWAIGPSSVMVRSIRASQPAGVIACSRASAPPVSCMVGRPDGRLTTPMSRQNTPRADAGAERLGAGLLGGEALGVGLDAVWRAARPCARSICGEDAIEEAVAVPLDRPCRCGGRR